MPGDFSTAIHAHALYWTLMSTGSSHRGKGRAGHTHRVEAQEGTQWPGNGQQSGSSSICSDFCIIWVLSVVHCSEGRVYRRHPYHCGTGRIACFAVEEVQRPLGSRDKAKDQGTMRSTSGTELHSTYRQIVWQGAVHHTEEARRDVRTQGGCETPAGAEMVLIGTGLGRLVRYLCDTGSYAMHLQHSGNTGETHCL